MRVGWSQLRGKLRPVTPSGETSDNGAESNLSVQSYEELERNFEKLGDIESQNECTYDERWKHEGVNIPWLISGYWVVWWVPLLWALGSLLTFYCINRRKFGQWFGLKKSAAATHLVSEPLALTIYSTFRLLLPKGYWGTVQGQRFYLLESLWLKFLLGVFFFILKNSAQSKDLISYFFGR